MNRLQKKCLIGSSALHALMLGLVLFGAALVPESKVPPTTRLTVVDLSKLTDGPTHGGSPAVASAPPPGAEPVQQTPPPAAPQHVETPPKPAPVKPPEPLKPPSSDFQIVKNDKPKTPVKDTSAEDAAKKAAADKAAADKAAKAAADAKQRAAQLASKNILNLGDKLSPSTKVELSGSGDGGEAAVNYRDLVANIYTKAWNPPASLDDESAAVTVSVTIARDGRVVARRITKPSGNKAMDASIEATLSNVTEIAPFPAGAKDAERTYIINFNLSAKRAIG